MPQLILASSLLVSLALSVPVDLVAVDDQDGFVVLSEHTTARNSTLQVLEKPLGENRKARVLVTNGERSTAFELPPSHGVLPRVLSPTSLPLAQLASLTLFDRPPLAVLLSGASSSPELLLHLARSFPETAVDAVDADPELLALVGDALGIRAKGGAKPPAPSLPGHHVRFLVGESPLNVSRASFYSAVFLGGSVACDLNAAEKFSELANRLSESLDDLGALVVPVTSSQCTQAVIDSCFARSITPSFRHAYLFGRHDPTANETQSLPKIAPEQALAIHRGFGPLKHYTLFNRARAIAATHDLPGPFQSNLAIPVSMHKFSNEHPVVADGLACENRTAQTAEPDRF